MTHQRKDSLQGKQHTLHVCVSLCVYVCLCAHLYVYTGHQLSR